MADDVERRIEQVEKELRIRGQTVEALKSLQQRDEHVLQVLTEMKAMSVSLADIDVKPTQKPKAKRLRPRKKP